MSADRATLLAEASRLIDTGAHRAAIPVLQALLRQDQRVEVYLNLARAQVETGDERAALETYHTALALAPTDARLINNIALVSARLGAAEVYDPTVLTATTWNAIGMSAYFRGDFQRARADLEQALQTDPECYAAYNNIADLIEPEESEAWIAKARALSPQAPEDRAAIAYMMAHLEDQRGDWAAAAAAWAEGGAAKIDGFAKPFDPEAQRRLVSSIIDTFDGETLRRLQTGSTSEARHIFVVGMPRSGSTLTSRMLGGDPSLRDMGEDRRLAQSVITVLERLGGGARAPFSAIDRAAAAEIHALYTADLPSGPAAHLNKYLENTLFLGLIWAAFPNARVIDTRRDRYDTLISCYSKNFTAGNAWSYRPADIAAYHAEYLRLMAHWARVLPPEMLMNSDYEALTADPKAAKARLLAHCGLDAAAASSDHRTGGAVETASAKQIRGEVARRDPARYAGYRPFIDFGPAPEI